MSMKQWQKNDWEGEPKLLLLH